MVDNLVIVESPAKAKTIEKFLGKDFVVTSSFGHVRDLEKKDFGIDIKNNFNPKYVVSDDKKKVVTELKKLAKGAKTVWLASDEDREGEAIAWHLFEVLKLKPENTKRIVFHEITKPAIINAIENPRDIDFNLVNAQQARRVLDRLVGFEISPVLWKKVKPSLSAGRVQSVAVKLIVEREREILGFTSTSDYKVNGFFKSNKTFKSELSNRFDDKMQVLAFLEKCKNATYSVSDIVKKPAKRKPAAPFTTSTLQQEASRKLGFSVSQTMQIAQKLYEAGKITYMRTDSVNLSETAINAAKKVITEEMGEKYLNTRSYTTKSKGAQEAHEAIRPTYLEKSKVSGSQGEKKLYDLIWKRTIASQMSDAQLERTTINIDISTVENKFVVKGEMIKFDGFLKVYMESTDDEHVEEDNDLLPKLTIGQEVDLDHILATQMFSHHPPRFTEASLVKKLEELGIGRPSTYAPTISTVVNRGYVVKEDREGVERNYDLITLKNAKVVEEVNSQISGAEKKKLFPTDIGMVVTDFLSKHFNDIMDYNFTAIVEKEFDDIAVGKIIWNEMIGKFYNPFHKVVEDTTENAERSSGERYLGVDADSGKKVFVRIGKYGSMAQLGESDDEEVKYAGLLNDQRLEEINLDQALMLFKLPRDVGQYEDKKVVAAIGRFGPYIRHDGKFVSLKKGIDDPFTIELDRAIELIEEKRETDRNKFIKSFEENEDLQILNGRWGPYISLNKKNYKLPKDVEPQKLTYEDCMNIINEADKAPAKKKTRKKK